MTSTASARGATRAMYVGLVLTVAATVVPYVDRATDDGLADHLRRGYPTYSESRIDTAVTMWLVYLTIVGVLGVACWVATIRAVRTGARWARPAATTVFATAAGVALTNLLIRDTSGDTGLPAPLGAVGLAPCVAGLVAVVLLWRPPRRAAR